MVQIAVIQMSTVYDKSTNLDKAERLIKEAASDGANVICLQELFNTVYFPWEMDDRHFALAEVIPGPSIERMQSVAAAQGITLIAPIYEKEQEGLYYNSATVIGPDGELAGTYRKSSIPLMKTPDLVGMEKYYFAIGNTGFITFDTPFDLRFGILICYDRHFPEAARALALRGAQLIFVPTATSGMSRDLWEVELRGHAAANMLYVAGVNRVGRDEGGSDMPFYGSSVVINAKAEVVARAGDTEDEVLQAELDLDALGEVRNRWGFFRDRRPDLYDICVR